MHTRYGVHPSKPSPWGRLTTHLSTTCHVVIMRYRIGEFSRLGKVSVKTLRHYDEIGLLKPGFVDIFNRYRYYLPEQLADLCAIRRYRRAGLSVDEISRILSGEDAAPILAERRRITEAEAESVSERLRLLDLLEDEGIDMTYDVEVKEIPGFTAVYRKGRIDTYADLTGFVMGFAQMCKETNPGLECTEDDYCFVTYDDLEYKERDIGLAYYQSVKSAGTPAGEIGFKDFDGVLAACVEHRGSYDRLGEAYSAIMQWMSENGMELADSPRECYVHGCWDRESEDDYLTEIQFPIKKGE